MPVDSDHHAVVVSRVGYSAKLRCEHIVGQRRPSRCRIVIL